MATRPTKHDPYESLRLDYANAMRASGALAYLTPADATRVAEQIRDLLAFYGRWDNLSKTVVGIEAGRNAVDDPRFHEQLHNRSINAPAHADGIDWNDPDAAGRAFVIAKHALTTKTPQHFPYWTTEDPAC